MNYQIVYSTSVRKDLKKIDKTVLKAILSTISEEIRNRPFDGNILKGNREIRAWKIRIKKVDYRIAYWIDENKQLVKIIFVKSRENYYKELGKRLI